MSDRPTRWQDSGWRLWWLTAIVIVADQWTKLLIIENFYLGESLQLLPFFDLTHVRNYGAAFSFLADMGGWQRWFLLIIAAVIAVVLTVWSRRMPVTQWWETWPLALIVGGAVGNVIDRARFGYVVDFLDVHYAGWHFPAFNVADSAISVGAVLLILGSFLFAPKTEQAA